MPEIDQTPKQLKPFSFHGLDLAYQPGDTQARAECPFCGKAGKLHIDPETSKWDCKICGERGNSITFIRQLWEVSDKATSPVDYDRFAEDRKLLYPETLMHWGAAKSIITGEWLIPAYSHDGKMNNVYRYTRNIVTGKMMLLSTPMMHHHTFGITLFDAKKKETYICEGPWDGMALWEALRSAKLTKQGLSLTGSDTSSLYANANIVAVPGCNAFPDSILPLIAGHTVYLMYDNDHSKELNGKTIEGAGLVGMKRASGALAKAEAAPEKVEYLCWGKDGYDLSLPSGTDVRDILARGATSQDRIPHLEGLLERIQSIPHSWIGGTTSSGKKGSVELECLVCESWVELTNHWRKTVKLTEGLYRALACMLASATSTEAPGDQLWLKIVGPASCGKSTLCEALSVAKKFVFANSTLTGFHSGFKTDKEGTEDHSLIPHIRNKTLIIKDGDTLLKNPQKDKILAQARDIYDRVSRVFYGNGVVRNQEGVNMTLLLCGTASLRELDTSELGERFLDVQIIDEIDDDLEDEIGRRVAHTANREMELQVNGIVESRDTPERILAKQKTGGYVEYLRKNALELLTQVHFPDHSLDQCQKLAKFVAYMRARPSKKQEEKAEREMSFRLISQLVRLAKCLAVVMNQSEVNDEVMRIVKQTALDTARGVMLKLATRLYDNQTVGGCSVAGLAIWVNRDDNQLKFMLRFLSSIGIAEPFQKVNAVGVGGVVKWRLSQKMLKLYTSVMVSQEEQAQPEEISNAADPNEDPDEGFSA